eukprot:10651683-Lingulodinium_polyedra.AAC.1
MPESGLWQQLLPVDKRSVDGRRDQTQAGDRVSFMSDKLPSQLGDAIKGLRVKVAEKDLRP